MHQAAYHSSYHDRLIMVRQMARRRVKDLKGLATCLRFGGELVFKTHRLCVSLNSRLESNKQEEERTVFPVLSNRRNVSVFMVWRVLGFPKLGVSEWSEGCGICKGLEGLGCAISERCRADRI